MTAPLPKIASVSEAMNQFGEILNRSKYRPSLHPHLTWMCPARYFEPAFIESIIKQQGPDKLLIDTDDQRDVLLSVWAVADMILDTQRKFSLPMEAVEAPHSFPPLGFTIQTAYDYHCYFANRAKEEAQRERQALRTAAASLNAADPTRLPGGERDEILHPLVAVAILRAEKDGLSGASERGRLNALNQLIDKPNRTLRCPDRRDLKALDAIETDFPHFTAVLDELRLQLRLQIAARSPLAFRPLLMVGPPGIGKTAFMRRLGEALNLSLLPVSAGTTTASWILKGGNQAWRSASAGAVASAVLKLKPRQGLLLMIDEVDKQPEGNFPIEPVLLELLEPEQNRHFTDEYLGVEMNLEPLLSVVLTANDLEPLSAPLLSRTTVVEVSTPTPAQMPAVLRSVDRELRREQPGLAKVFRPLPEEALKELGSVSLREARATLMRAYGRALERSGRGKRRLEPEDIRVSRPKRVLKGGTPPSGADITVEDLLRLVLVRSLPPAGGAPPGTILH